MNDAIEVGVAVVVAAIFAVIGMQVATSADYNDVYTVDSDSEWNEGTLTSVNVSNGEVLLDSTSASGSYESATFSNETNRFSVYADVPDADNSSVTLSVGGNTYDLSDGRNTVSLDTSVTSYSFTLDFSRDADTVESPSVSSVTAQYGESGMMTLIATAAFALLVLLAVLQLRNRVGLSRPQ